MVKHGTLSLVFHAGWSIRTTFVHVPGRLMLENMPSFPGLIFQQDWYSMDHIPDQPTRLCSLTWELTIKVNGIIYCKDWQTLTVKLSNQTAQICRLI